jgi:hypothetical protein
MPYKQARQERVPMSSSSPNPHHHSNYMEAYPQPASIYGQLHPAYTPPDHPPYPEEVAVALSQTRQKTIRSVALGIITRIWDVLTHHRS